MSAQQPDQLTHPHHQPSSSRLPLPGRGLAVAAALALALLLPGLAQAQPPAGLKLPFVRAEVADPVFLADIAEGISALTLLDLPITVSAPPQHQGKATAYAFKLGKAALTDCREEVGYSGWRSTNQPLVVDLAATADGTALVLCLLGDVLRGPRQPTGHPTVYTWVKQTGAPTYHILAPLSPSADPSPTVIWQALPGARSYDLSIAQSPDCSAPLQQYLGLTVLSQTLAPLHNGTHYACLVSDSGIEAANSPYPWIQSVDFPPGPFLITGPLSPVETDSATVSWQAAADATSYRLAVSLQADCSAPLLSYSGLTATAHTLDPLLDGSYHACVTAVAASGLTTAASNDGYLFTIAVPGPGPFLILGPSGQQTTDTPTAFWQAAERAVAYALLVSAEPECSAPLQSYAALTDLSQPLSPLPNGDYSLCLTAFDAAGRATAASNNGHSFSVAVDYPGPFAITGPLSPVPIATPLVTWETSADAVRYDLLIAANPDCEQPLQVYAGLVETSQTLAPLDNGSYHACLTAFNAAGRATAATNDGYGFEVLVEPPGPFLITGPTDPVASQTALITWQISERAVSYDLALSAQPDCSDPLQFFPELETTSQLSDPLSNGTYYACVTARDQYSRTATASNNGFAFAIDYTPPKTHRIFVSSIETSIDSTMRSPPRLPAWGGIDNGDWTCTYLAFLSGLVPDWDGVAAVYQALLSIEGLAARDRIAIEGEVFNMAGEAIAWGADDFWSGTHLSGVTYNEMGAAVPMGSYVWTGTQANGQWAGASCGQWNYLSDFGMVGVADSESGFWTQVRYWNCSERARLYCVGPAE